jgi:hypothetical protein
MAKVVAMYEASDEANHECGSGVVFYGSMLRLRRRRLRVEQNPNPNPNPKKRWNDRDESRLRCLRP